MPSPVVPDQMPIARARRSSSVNTFVRIDSVDGMMPAAPTPMNARAAMSAPGLPEKAEVAEAAANSVRPSMNTHLRPRRSPRLPTARRSPANTMA